MKTFLFHTIWLVFLASLLSCGLFTTEETPETEPTRIELTPDATETIARGNDFGIDLFTRTAAEETGNLMVSPLSASVALTMLLNGSDSDTRTQIQEMLGYPADQNFAGINEAYRRLIPQLLEADRKVALAVANAIFYREHFPFKDPFLTTMADDFDANVKGLDFDQPSAVSTINKWASDNTNGKIPKVMDSIDRDMVMFIMNALYFKGDWSYQFDKGATGKQTFHLGDGSTVQVDMMKGKAGVMRYEHGDYSVVELPYGRKNFSMVIIVPSGTLSDFYPEFSSATWRNITASLDNRNEWTKTDIVMPKFGFDYEKVLNKQLKAMGMTDAFDANLADLSGISDEDIFVGFVKQNAFIEVNEEGTEAAAVTTIGIEVTSAGPPAFIVDRPFIFAIRERTTNTLLFMGGVANPAD
jgi:serpin B